MKTLPSIECLRTLPRELAANPSCPKRPGELKSVMASAGEKGRGRTRGRHLTAYGQIDRIGPPWLSTDLRQCQSVPEP